MNSIPVALAAGALILAAVPAALFLLNLLFYRRPREQSPGDPALPLVSVLIPARNEEATIAAALESVLSSRDVPFEVVVLDDHSTDATQRIVTEFAGRHPQVRLIQGRTLPDDWCGKQHACWQLAGAARGEFLVFMDADVRLEPDGLTRMAAFLQRRPQVHLASGVPRQITVTWAEKLVLPLIHFVLLGFLPLAAARWSRWSAFAAGCGQLFIARRAAYFAMGGHSVIRKSLHDGITLPRAFRRAGFQSDLFDATDVARCRMYHGTRQVFEGLMKNAGEAMANPAAILPWTILLGAGQVLPWLLLLAAPWLPPTATFVALVALALGWGTRWLAVGRFRLSAWGALWHPVGVAILLGLQWIALRRSFGGRPLEWRGRRYPAHSNLAGGKPVPS